MNSREKWEELEDSKRLKAIGQNGNNGEHYEEESGQLEFNFWEEQETTTPEVIDEVCNEDLFSYISASSIGKPETYNLNVDKIKTISDVKLVLDSMNVCFQSFDQVDEKHQNLIDKGLFKLKED
jgi:hypothetical protein